LGLLRIGHRSRRIRRGRNIGDVLVLEDGQQLPTLFYRDGEKAGATRGTIVVGG
jgi:hypothetical protein